uniref:Uncharacterized protein n=1 Tax=Glypta fumiferanae TaxID=389681 RepID=A0A0F6T1D8_9HYME|nr:hypothetical protein [Glypta fumiferanae]
MSFLRDENLPPEYRIAELKCLQNLSATSCDDKVYSYENSESKIRDQVELSAVATSSGDNAQTIVTSFDRRIKEATRRYNVKMRRIRLTEKRTNVCYPVTLTVRKS